MHIQPQNPQSSPDLSLLDPSTTKEKPQVCLYLLDTQFTARLSVYNRLYLTPTKTNNERPRSGTVTVIYCFFQRTKLEQLPEMDYTFLYYLLGSKPLNWTPNLEPQLLLIYLWLYRILTAVLLLRCSHRLYVLPPSLARSQLESKACFPRLCVYS